MCVDGKVHVRGREGTCKDNNVHVCEDGKGCVCEDEKAHL
jgi:hypothetical protein